MGTNSVAMTLTLEPVGQPWVRVKINGTTHLESCLSDTVVLKLETELLGDAKCLLEVEHFDKQDNDATTAVVVQRIDFFGISDPRFVWAGTYYPDYPEHYQDKKPKLPGQGYLGWNGVYRLEFDIPVFTWIHRTLNMGWLYD